MRLLRIAKNIHWYRSDLSADIDLADAMEIIRGEVTEHFSAVQAAILGKEVAFECVHGRANSLVNSFLSV